MLLGSMNATDLQTYAALQKPSHVFGNYAVKTEKEGSKGKGKEGDQTLQQKQAQTTATNDSTQAQSLENIATTDSTTATTDKAYTKSTDQTVANAAQQVETDETAVQNDETALEKAVEKVQADANAKDFDEKTFTADQQAEQTAESNLKTAEGKLNTDQQTLETDLQDQKKTPTPSTPPTKEEPKKTASSEPTPSTPPTKEEPKKTASSEPTPSTPPTKEEPKKTASSEPTPSTPPTKEEPKKTASSEPTPSTPPTKEEPKKTASSEPTPSTPPTKTEPSSTGNSVASQLVKDANTVNGFNSVSVSGMNTTLSGVETMVQQTTTISTLLNNSSTDLSSVISNAQGLSSAFGALESTQNTLKGYLDSSSATIGQLTNGSNAVVGALDKAINQVDMALADLATADTQKTQAVTLAATGSSANSTTTTDAINFLNALKSNLTAQKATFMNVHKNIQTAVAQAQATYTPSVMNTNNYGQMYGVDAMAGYKWFFGKTKRFGFRSYGYYSYNHANLSFVGSQLGIMEGASQVNNFTYGVGFDALYNFYESKEGYNTAGLFLGFGLGGDSFIVQGESYLKSQMQICNNTAGCSASMNTSYFQMPVQFGFRSNFSKHSGIEVGFKLPLFTNQFYKERGVDGSVDVFYKRNFSIYFNYMINF